MASPSEDATPMWDFMSPEDDNAMLEKFSAESNKVINRWSLGSASVVEKDAAVSFLVQLGAVQITIQSDSQQVASQKQVSIQFGDEQHIKTEQEHAKANPVETKDAIPSTGNLISFVSQDQDTREKSQAQINDDNDEEEDNNYYSAWMTEPDDGDDDDIQIPGTAPVVGNISATQQPREEHPCPDCHVVLHSTWDLDLHKLHDCAKSENPIQLVYNCDQCRKSFSKVFNAVTHLRKVHDMAPSEVAEKLAELKDMERGKGINEVKAEESGSKLAVFKNKELQDQGCVAKQVGEENQCTSTDPLMERERQRTDPEINESHDEQTCEPSELIEQNNFHDIADKRPKEINSVHVDGSECENNATTCQKSKESLASRRGLERHINSVHNKNVKYTCEVCGKKFYTTSKVKQHIENHYKERAFKCEECGKGFLHAYQLKIHKEKVHSNADPCICDVCGSAFKCRGNLRQHHLTAHTNVYNYSCNVCGKKFKRSFHRNAHLKVHSDDPNDRPFKCEICMKGFRFKDKLKVHMDWHCNIRSHTCDVCGKSFLTKGNLDKHRYVHQSKRPHECWICSSGFRDLPRLRKHLDVKHKITLKKVLTEGVRNARASKGSAR